MTRVRHSLSRKDMEDALDMLFRQLTATKLEQEQTEACIKLFERKLKRLPDGED